MLKKEGKKTDWVNIPLQECLSGNGMDAYYTAKVYMELIKGIKTIELENLYEKLISPISIVFRDIENEGMLIDTNKLDELETELLIKISQAKTSMMDTDRIPNNYELAGHDLLEILFSLKKSEEGEWEINENIGFGLYPFSKTKTGQPSTDDESMTKLKELVDREVVKRKLHEKV